MNAPLTRRFLLSATATLGAVVLPAAAPALASPTGAMSSEAVALLREFLDELEPERPVALHFSGADGLNCGFDIEVMPGGRRLSLYGLQDVEKLRGMPLPRRCEETFTRHPELPNDRILHRTWVPDQRRIARRAEILAAHDAWMVERQAVKDRLGMDAADEAEEEACQALWEIEKAILACEQAWNFDPRVRGIGVQL